MFRSMRVALLGAVLTFAGSIAGFGLASAADEPLPVAAPPAREQIVEVPDRRDCPEHRRERREQAT